MYQEPTNISTYFYDTSSIAISFTVSDTSLLNTKQKYYYMASATDISLNITYATGYTSPIYITKLIPGITYTCRLYLVQTASSDSIIVNTQSFPSFESASIIELSMNSIKLKWIGSDISYVSVKKSILGQSYIDLSSSVYSSTFTYSDSDISGNTLYSYSITPYMTKTGSLIKGNDTILSNTTPIAYPTDLSATFFDTSAIQLSFTAPKNTYNTSVYYTAQLIYQGNIISKTGTSPILIQNLTQGITYSCYINTLLDNTYNMLSNPLSVTTFVNVSNSNMIYYYKFNINDYINSQFANYASGSAVYENTQSIANGTIITTDYKVGNACWSANTKNISLSSFTISSPFNGMTIAFWYKYTTYGGSYASVFSFSSYSILLRKGGGGNFEFILNNKIQNLGSFPTTNVWNHLVFIVPSGTNPPISYYLNNTLILTFYLSITSTELNKTYTNNYLHSSDNGGGNSGTIGAKYDDFRFYNRVLSLSEINTIYSST